jgi:hypothetical protein
MLMYSALILAACGVSPIMLLTKKTSPTSIWQILGFCGLSTLIVYYLSSIVDSMTTKTELPSRVFSFKEFQKIQTERDILNTRSMYKAKQHPQLSQTSSLSLCSLWPWRGMLCWPCYP